MFPIVIVFIHEWFYRMMLPDRVILMQPIKCTFVTARIFNLDISHSFCLVVGITDAMLSYLLAHTNMQDRFMFHIISICEIFL